MRIRNDYEVGFEAWPVSVLRWMVPIYKCSLRQFLTNFWETKGTSLKMVVQYINIYWFRRSLVIKWVLRYCQLGLQEDAVNGSYRLNTSCYWGAKAVGCLSSKRKHDARSCAMLKSVEDFEASLGKVLEHWTWCTTHPATKICCRASKIHIFEEFDRWWLSGTGKSVAMASQSRTMPAVLAQRWRHAAARTCCWTCWSCCWDALKFYMQLYRCNTTHSTCKEGGEFNSKIPLPGSPYQ